MTKRIAITTSDIAFITGKSLRHSRTLLRKIRITLNKSKEQIVTFKEFSLFIGVEEVELREAVFGKEC